jgi:ABC-type sulfate transport system permease component
MKYYFEIRSYLFCCGHTHLECFRRKPNGAVWLFYVTSDMDAKLLVCNLADPGLLLALKNTLIIAGGAALVGPLVFSSIAYILVRTNLPGRALLDALC